METNNEKSDIKLIMVTIGNGNPGAYNIMAKILSEIKSDNIVINFINKLLEQNIVGARLWYIFKNEASLDITKLLELDLETYDDKYFYKKYEKYSQND